MSKGFVLTHTPIKVKGKWVKGNTPTLCANDCPQLDMFRKRCKLFKDKFLQHEILDSKGHMMKEFKIERCVECRFQAIAKT